MNRKAIFDAVKRMLGRGYSTAEVRELDAAIDAALAPPPPPSDRQIGAAGLALIKEFEGLRLSAYLCPAGVPTIGYGSTGPHVRIGQRITEPEAEALLRKDLTRFEKAVDAKVPNATQNQFDAMVALAFNIGEAGFGKSTVARMAAAGKHGPAADAFAMWNKAGGKVLPGLTRRRKAEADLYRRVA